MPAPIAEASPSDAGGLSLKARSLLLVLESMRDLLSRRLVQEQVIVPDPDLNYAVVSSIFQALFLSAGQACGFVAPDTMALLASSEGIGKRMGRACADAGLTPELFFEPGPDGARRLPALSDPALHDLMERMGTRGVPVPLAVLSAEELAAVLEHFVATRLEVDGGCRVKKTVKSAVLYTGSVDVPHQHVVDAVAGKSLRGILRGRSASSETAILDPACGAGIFLLAAYRSVASHHPVTMPPENADGACRSIYGVDIDPESVSAARLVLLLACIGSLLGRGSGQVTAGHIRTISARVSKNVRCGNSLIAPEYFSGRSVHPFNADERRKVNPFDWDAAFPAVLARGGFDAAIGAPPPYMPFFVQARDAYFQTHYASYQPSAGLYGYFIERTLALLRPGGAIGFLLPSAFLRSRHARELRRMLLTRQIDLIADTGKVRPLQGVNNRIIFLLLANRDPDQPFVVPPAPGGGRSFADAVLHAQGFRIDQQTLGDGGWVLDDTRAADLLARIRRNATPLGEYIMGEWDAGNYSVRNNPRIVDAATRDRLAEKAWCRRFFVPLLRSGDIRRWVPAGPARFVIRVKSPHQLRKCRALEKYLEEIREDAVRPEHAGTLSGDAPYPAEPTGNGPAYPGKIPKIFFAAFQHSPAFAYDPKGSFATTTSVLAIPRDDPVLLAVLNSTLGRFIVTHTCPLSGRGYAMGPPHLGKFPVIAPDFDRLPEKFRHAKITALVMQMLSLHEFLQKVKTDQERRFVRQEIDATDVKIDALVYELYGLTAEEIAVVEGSPLMV